MADLRKAADILPKNKDYAQAIRELGREINTAMTHRQSGSAERSKKVLRRVWIPSTMLGGGLLPLLCDYIIEQRVGCIPDVIVVVADKGQGIAVPGCDGRRILYPSAIGGADLG